MAYEVYHKMQFSFERDNDTWPRSLPWPEWKPATDKTYQPAYLSFNIGWKHGGNVRQPVSVTVAGFRFLKNGQTGASVRCEYYNGLHPVFQELIDGALRAAREAKENYEIRG